MAVPDKESLSGIRTFRVVLLGVEGVGKSSIYKRLQHDTFNGETVSSQEANDFTSQHRLPSGEEVNVQLWDTVGVERYRSLTQSYYAKAHAMVFVYSADNLLSLRGLKHSIEDAVAYGRKNALHLFVRNKIDLSSHENELVTDDEVKDFFEELRQEGFAAGGYDKRELPPYSTSAKTGEGVRNAMDDVIRRISELELNSATCSIQPSFHPSTESDVIVLGKTPTQPKRKWSCRWC